MMSFIISFHLESRFCNYFPIDLIIKKNFRCRDQKDYLNLPRQKKKKGLKKGTKENKKHVNTSLIIQDFSDLKILGGKSPE